MPLLFMLVIGFGLRPSGSGYQGVPYHIYVFPGIVAMSMLFTSTFSAISIIWDREFGFLKEVLVSPISRWAIVIGKSLGGATQGFFQGVVMLIFLSLFIRPSISIFAIIPLLITMFAIAFCLTALGIAIAARMRSFEGFQVIMNFVVMPIFFFSGALYAIEEVPDWLQWVTRIDPLTYGVDLLRHILVGVHHYPSHWNLGILTIFGVAILGLAVFQFRQVE